MKILKYGTVMIAPDGNATFVNFTIECPDGVLPTDLPDEEQKAFFARMARVVLDDAYQRALAFLNNSVIVDVTSDKDQVH